MLRRFVKQLAGQTCVLCQSRLSVHRARQGLVKARTAQANQIRGLLSEFGIVMPQRDTLD